MKAKKGFTIVELVVVISIVGILTLFAMPKLLGHNKDAFDVSLQADLKTVQTAVDLKTIDNGGESPYELEIGDAKKIELNTLKPDYVKTLVPKKGYDFWVDGWGTVTYNGIHPPKNVKYQGGTLSWDKVENAQSYNIYEVVEDNQVTFLNLIGIETVHASDFSSFSNLKKKLYTTTEDLSIELPQGKYLVSAVKKEIESVPVGENYDGSEESQENNGNNEGTNTGENNSQENGSSGSEGNSGTGENVEGGYTSNDSHLFAININDQIVKNEDGTISFNEVEGGWQFEGEDPQVITSDGEFVTGGPGMGYYYLEQRGLKVATFELTVKSLLNQNGLNGSMIFRTGTSGVAYYFYPDRVDIYNDISKSPIATVPLNGTEYHTYRIVKNDTNATLYVDGNLIGEFKLRTGTGNNQYRFIFGDGTSNTALSEIYFKDLLIAPNELLYLD